jgi:uncharacterized membrane protein YagU involved in acid resistance
MSGAMFLMKKIGMVPGELEPKEIAENVEEAIGVRSYLPQSTFEASWATLHFGYGTASGVAYAFTQKVFDRDRPFLFGPLFGTLLWAVGYCGWLPMLGLYPPPARLPKPKVTANILAHAVYGTATAAMHRMLRSES